jgi:putative membrane protein
MRILIRILFTTFGVLLAAYLVPGVIVAGFWTAVLVAIVLGILNVTIGFVLKVLTFPLSLVSFGLFFLVINAFLFWMASFVKGFHVAGFWAAFFGALIVTVLSMVGRMLVRGNGATHWH